MTVIAQVHEAVTEAWRERVEDGLSIPTGYPGIKFDAPATGVYCYVHVNQGSGASAFGFASREQVASDGRVRTSCDLTAQVRGSNLSQGPYPVMDAIDAISGAFERDTTIPVAGVTGRLVFDVARPLQLGTTADQTEATQSVILPFYYEEF